MLKSQPYYFENIVFQLELNLQSIRRELIKLLDEYNHSECFSCNRLRCRCFEESPSIDSGQISDEEVLDVRSPPPYTLPTPQWRTDLISSIDAWVKASTEFSFRKTRKFPLSKRVLSQMNLTWPPLQSIWNDRIGCQAMEKENEYKSEGERCSVDEFFGYFSLFQKSPARIFYGGNHGGFRNKIFLNLEDPHPLLEPASPAYSNATVRRAFIVWMHCGQRNSFKDVCNYYHYLESLEDKLPADRRAASRHYEFNMFSNPPPTSPYLEQIFPKLYTQSNTIQHYIKKVESIRNTAFDVEKHEKVNTDEIKLETFSDMQNQKGVTTNEILVTSQMIKKYCKTYMKPLKKFLAEFKEYAKKCALNYTVNNVAFYIKRKMVEEELQMVSNYSRTLSFLNLNTADKSEESNDFLNACDRDKSLQSKGEKNKDQMKLLSSLNPQKQVTILTRDKKKEFMNQYWDSLTTNFGAINLRHNVTRT